MTIKAGYKTSEFWFTLVSFIFSGLYLAGILKENDQKEELITIVSHAVESVILIGGQVWILAKYIKGRTEVKKIVEQEKFKNEAIDDNKRTSNRTSRKTTPRTKTKTTKTKKRSTK
jgi:ABC-type Mn2+/Zn2+ transport system ATPase subunit